MAPMPLHLISLDFCLLSLALFYRTQTCLGFNLDVRFPVIKEGKTKGSFFGFSVAMHRQTEGSKRYLMLAGAPKEKAVPQLQVNETGAVYSCPITTDPSDCTRMDLVSSMESYEMVEGMWLGVSVASQREQPGGRVLACGHRYVVKGGTEEQRRMIGKCYVRGNDLSYDSDDDWQTYSYEACNPNFDMEQEGMCNMGMSAGMTETDVYTGSPGSFVWQGNVHVTWRDPTPGNSWDSNVKSFGQLDKRYSYMGYSVLEERKLLSRDDYTVVTGSPREEAKGSITMGVKTDTDLQAVITILGEQVGSYFGSCLAVTDLNNDDWNDLIVGAPFYFDRKKEEGGAVYVFMNENGSFQENATLVLKGFRGSAFGMALAAIGDVNQDGFQDFAVGAPFHGSGKVFIWMGSKKGISQEPSQVIDGNEVGKGRFQTFGYSVNGGLDMDENSYPDVLVGSLDDSIVLLRARPVIHLSKSFTVMPKIVDPSTCPPGEKACVTVKVCFSYTLSTGNKDFKKNITVKYTVEADRDRRSSRVRFLSNKQDIYTGFLSMPSTTCQELELSLVDPVRDKLEPVVFSLNVSLHEQRPKARRSLQNLDAFPMLSGPQSLSEKAEINFQKECGADNKCTSNLQLKAEFANEQQVPYPRREGHQILEYSSNVKKVMLKVEVTNFPESGKLAEDAHQAMLNISVPPTLRYSGVRTMNDPDIECRAEENRELLCELGNPFRGNEEKKFLIIFETTGISLYTHEIEAQLQLFTLSEQNDLYPTAVSLVIEFSIQTSFSLEKQTGQTQFSGKVMGESAMKSTNDVGSPVEYVFEVAVLGEPLGTMGTLVVEFDWPYEVRNGKWLLYLTEIVTKGTSETHCVPPGEVVNLLNLTLSDQRSSRLRREVDATEPQSIQPQAAITLQTSHKEYYLLDCERGTARCVKFTCPLHNMTNNAKLIVRARVWNSTMLEDYIDASRVTVKGQATLKLVTDKPTIKMNSETRGFSLDIDPVLGKDTPYEVPLWIIILAGVAGVLLLGLIILILWKCGFFRRASRREMYEAKAQKAEMKIQPSETEKLTEDY
ncbi:hypothetical protein MATL_G00014280 [Megalops atlanticus]|uniref:Integrin alpha-2 domain-containing protein n=1 Tax=Megalops atlanticus TaxID=7932 RepID=A0A9D3QHX0_MEGAT|nr:hypothetical protein MATL_G00014280 [Megalops atlanticus]